MDRPKTQYIKLVVYVYISCACSLYTNTYILLRYCNYTVNIFVSNL